jgi:hypothetical protein
VIAGQQLQVPVTMTVLLTFSIVTDETEFTLPLEP